MSLSCLQTISFCHWILSIQSVFHSKLPTTFVAFYIIPWRGLINSILLQQTFLPSTIVVFVYYFAIRKIPISFGLVIRTLINLQHNKPHSFCAYGEHIYSTSHANFCHLSKCEMINTHAAHAHPKTNITAALVRLIYAIGETSLHLI